jgi:hypothetical protein
LAKPATNSSCFCLLLGGQLLVGILLGLVGHGFARVEADVLEQHDVARL